MLPLPVHSSMLTVSITYWLRRTQSFKLLILATELDRSRRSWSAGGIVALRSQLRIIRPKPKEAWPFLGFGYGSLSECGNLYPTVPLTTAGAIKTLARKIARWVADNRHRLVGEPFIPEALDD